MTNAQVRALEAWFETNHAYRAIHKLRALCEVFRIPCEVRELFDGWELAYPNTEDCLISMTEIGSIYHQHGDKVEAMTERNQFMVMTAEEAAEYLYRFHRYRRMNYE